MTDHVKIRVHLNRPAKSNVPDTAGRGGSRPTRDRGDTRPDRKRRKRGLLALLFGALGVGLASAYVLSPATKSPPSGSETLPIDGTAANAPRSMETGAGIAGTGGTEDAAPSSPAALLVPANPLDPSAGAKGSAAAGRPSEPTAEPPTKTDVDKRTGDAPASPEAPREPDPPRAEAVPNPVPEPAPMAPPPERTPTRAALEPPPAAVPSLDKRVARSQLTSEVREREPVDRLGSSLTAGEGNGRAVVYFTELRGMTGQTVVHRWERDGQVVSTIPFRVEGPRWRVHSRQTLAPGQKGNWRVVLADAAGAELASESFVVTPR